MGRFFSDILVSHWPAQRVTDLDLDLDLHFKELRFLKAPNPIWVTESGMVKFAKEQQPQKA